ncbi:MAG: aspartate kinase, partial [Bacteroidales bacterium]|nr:aspartate kinase [Bacteroidales bacterium]
MKVFKFGGASVKDAAAVRNLVSIIEKQKNQHLMIVLSAMGKTTNGLEKLLLSAREKPFVYEASMEHLKTFHFQIVEELFGEDKNIKTRLHSLFVALEADLIQNRSLAYDQ